MIYWKRYTIFGLILIMVACIKLNTWDDDYAEVEAFRGAALQEEVFYPLKASNINEEGLLQLEAEGTSYGYADGVLMGSELSPLISLELAEKLFGCSACLYEDGTVQLFYDAYTFTFTVGEATYTYKGKEYALTAKVEQREYTAYLPIEDLCTLFKCDYTYDEASYQAAIVGEIVMGDLPASFDLRSISSTSEVKDQGTDSTCWAQAAIAALESTLLPTRSFSLSVSDMVENNAFALSSDMGGDFAMALAYLLSWQGPVADGQVAVHLQEVHFYDQDDVEAIKWSIYQNGGVTTSIYTNVSTLTGEGSTFYNSSTNSYCYTGSNSPNHDVIIIGWDDNYSADNFTTAVEGDGAFICQNSWGEDFGDGGIFYVSYYDRNICNQAVAYTSVETNYNYSSIYQSDLCGWVGQIGFGKASIYAANVFTATADEEICAAGFYALGANTSYEVYIVANYNNVSSLASRVQVASGTLEDAGYYTIDFDRGYEVLEGQEFAVIIVLNTPGEERPLAVEYAADEMTVNVDITDGEGYISVNGLDWTRVETSNQANICLKAYGRMVD